MPRFIVNRQYLIPICQTIAVEAETIEDACREAIYDESKKHDWIDASQEWELSFDHCVTDAMEVIDEQLWNEIKSSQEQLGNVITFGHLKGENEICVIDRINCDVDIPEEFSQKCDWDYINDKPVSP